MDETGPPDPAEQDPREATRPAPDGPDDPAAFLRTVRALVHGEQVPSPRPGSDSWRPDDEDPAADAAPEMVPTDGPGDVAGVEPVSGWLPGRWEVDPTAPSSRRPAGGRRRADSSRRGQSTEQGGKSAKSSRWMRRGRTVEVAAQRGAPGAEVPMEERRREPDLQPVPSAADQAAPEGPGASTAGRGGRGRGRRHEDLLAPAPEHASGEPSEPPADVAENARAEAVDDDPDLDGASKTERAARKARAAQARREAREQALVDRAAALVAKAEAKAERDRLKARRDPDSGPDSGPGPRADGSEGEQPAAPGTSRVGRKAAKQAARDETRAARAAAKERAQLERAAAEALAAEARAEREAGERRARAEREATEAARARDRAEREAEEEHARVARITEEVAETIARLEAEARSQAEGRDAKTQARIARVAARAEARAARVARRSQAASDRAAAKTERRLRRRAAKAQQRADRAAAGARAKSEVAAEHARRAAELEARAIAVDPTDTDERRVERLADYIARVESQRSGRARGTRFSRRARAATAGAVIVVAALVPWVAPQVPAAISGILPGHDGKPVHVTDPPVAPPTAAFVGPVGVQDQAGPYDGVRLQAAGWPREVQVDRLHVDSTVVPISGQSGSLLPPSDPQVLGWWKEGRPAGAEYGSAVITGHTVHTGGGALDHLDKLVVGDSVRVRTDAGWIRYEVQRTRVYSTAQLARDAKQIFALGGPGRLVLITCDNWNGSFYESNAVVFAVPVADEPS